MNLLLIVILFLAFVRNALLHPKDALYCFECDTTEDENSCQGKVDVRKCNNKDHRCVKATRIVGDEKIIKKGCFEDADENAADECKDDQFEKEEVCICSRNYCNTANVKINNDFGMLCFVSAVSLIRFLFI